MKRSILFRATFLMMILFLLAAGVGVAVNSTSFDNEVASNPGNLDSYPGTSFTYQGQLAKAGAPLSDFCELHFRLYADEFADDQIGATVQQSVVVTNGYFDALLDFGDAAFTGEARWLEIEVKCSGDADFTLLTPRSPVMPSPYALALPGFWTQQHGISPNLIGGISNNIVKEGVWGATVSGGGTSWKPNLITDNYGVIGGGEGNRTGNDDEDFENAEFSTIGGGLENVAQGHAATISGGINNQATGTNSTVGGGADHLATGEYNVTVSGGYSNAASSSDATVSGGNSNTAEGWAATVSGGHDNQTEGSAATISGGGENTASANVTTIGGGSNNEASDHYATVGGGGNNLAGGNSSTVAGGQHNTADADYATVDGGASNKAIGFAATVGGGRKNEANAEHAVVAGGYWNVSEGITSTIGGGQQNFINQDYATIGGGRNNQIYADYGTIGGGGGEDSASANIIYDTGGTIGGGRGNIVGTENSEPTDAQDATVSGGFQNAADGSFSTVGGGDSNQAGGLGSTVAGGYSNTASGRDATIPGGAGNLASGDYSFAAGYQAQAKHEGVFVWADHEDGQDFESTSSGQFLIRASGGVGIGTNDPMATLHVQDEEPEMILAKHDGLQWNMEINPAGASDETLLSIGTRQVGQYEPFFESIMTLATDGVVSVDTLRITGGLDLAEPFEIAGQESAQPGMAVSIDPAHPGQLRISDRGYDRLAAGCVSGANGINPGLMLAQEGVVDEASVPVALSGRVYCYADATYGSIQPGDLLTTSDTPGHLMAVQNAGRAQGAVVGKAMSGLEQGQGFVLVLVSLQ